MLGRLYIFSFKALKDGYRSKDSFPNISSKFSSDTANTKSVHVIWNNELNFFFHSLNMICQSLDYISISCIKCVSSYLFGAIIICLCLSLFLILNWFDDYVMQCSELWGCKHGRNIYHISLYQDRNRKHFWNVWVLLLGMMKSKVNLVVVKFKYFKTSSRMSHSAEMILRNSNTP